MIHIFFYNNLSLMSELDNYYISLYGEYGVPIDIDCINFFVKQNINYFLVMFILLFMYRKLNLKEDTN